MAETKGRAKLVALGALCRWYRCSARSRQLGNPCLSGVGPEENVDEKDKRDWSHSIGSSSAVRGAYIASSKFVFVRGQGASPYRATANTRERCWRPPQASVGVHITVDLITAAAITLIATTAAITAIATMATITIIGATLITAIAIGETYRLVAASKLVIRVRARAAAHAAAFSLSAVSEATRHFGRGRAANPNPAGGDEMRK